MAVALVVMMIAALVGGSAGTLEAQSAPPATQSETSAGGLRVLLGEAPDRRRVIGAMWALHPFEPQFPEVEWTSGFGVQFSQLFLATFVNSYDDRAFVGGIERYWASTAPGPVGFGVGYRLGLVTGYDERLFELARHTPVLPFIGLLVWGDAGPFGLDAFYVYRAITLEASMRF